jgi:hypothetical protein
MIGVKWCFSGTGVGWLCLVGLKTVVFTLG